MSGKIVSTTGTALSLLSLKIAIDYSDSNQIASHLFQLLTITSLAFLIVGSLSIALTDKGNLFDFRSSASNINQLAFLFGFYTLVDTAIFS